MTAQFNDIFIYHNIEYAIAGISEGMLFEPTTFGLKPVAASTACWRGYVATFAISESHLVLDSLSVNLHEDDEQDTFARGPSINGITPTIPTDTLKMFDNIYLGLNYQINYTGGLLLGSEFIRELYVHMGFHPAWKYNNVIELIFENGVLTGEFDRSARMAEIRQKIQEPTDGNEVDRNRMPTRDEISEFVERSFDRSYTKGEW